MMKVEEKRTELQIFLHNDILLAKKIDTIYIGNTLTLRNFRLRARYPVIYSDIMNDTLLATSLSEYLSMHLFLYSRRLPLISTRFLRVSISAVKGDSIAEHLQKGGAKRWRGIRWNLRLPQSRSVMHIELSAREIHVVAGRSSLDRSRSNGFDRAIIVCNHDRDARVLIVSASRTNSISRSVLMIIGNYEE